MLNRAEGEKKRRREEDQNMFLWALCTQ